MPVYLFVYLNNAAVREKRVRPYVTISTISGINQDGLCRITIVVPSSRATLFFAPRTSKLFAKPITFSKPSCTRRSLTSAGEAIP